ncbi:MAG: phage baseplate assembly protein V [Deltaproteobacteria bacterium]|nr:phage baseplate assembly protein V [Deltaproteobacteria bacterium]
MDSIEKVVANLVQKVERRFYGKYRGFVVDNADPEQLGRLKVKVPSVLGNDVVTGWAMPCTPYGGDAGQGFLCIPEVDAGLWVEFEEGDLEFPIWVGTFWSKPDGESELPKPNDADGAEQDSVQDPPTRKIIKTKKGHTIQFEDADGDEMVTIIQNIDESKHNVITMNKDGIKITDSTDNCIEMKEDAFNITSKVAFTIDASGQAVEIKADTVDFTKAS